MDTRTSAPGKQRPSGGESRSASVARTDPYPPCEKRLGLTRACLEVLVGRRGGRIDVVTRSDLILRDADLLVAAKERAAVTVCVPALTWEGLRKLQPDAPPPRERLETIRRLRGFGIRCGLRIDPVLPGATDHLHQLRRLVSAASRVGALWVDARGLRLPPASRDRLLQTLGAWRPALARRYRARYGRDGNPPTAWRERLRAVVASLAVEFGLGYGLGDGPWSRSVPIDCDSQLRLPFRAATGSSEYPGGRCLLKREARAGALAVAV